MNQSPSELSKSGGDTAETKEPDSYKNEIISFFKTLGLLILAAIILRASVVEAFKIPSGSMNPTLVRGDHILVSKLSYGFRLPFKKETLYRFSEPKRGDVVVFTRPDDPRTADEDESDINIIKRVIGLPGDMVEVNGRKVYINSELLDEPYARWKRGGIPEGNWGPRRVAEGSVFLLGDNRDYSRDSRFWRDQPFLPLERIKGRALFIYWTWDSDFLGRIGNAIR